MSTPNKISSTEFVTRVVEMFDAREGVFANKVNVEDWVPINFNPLQSAIFLFFITQLDYAIKSQILYTGATKLAKEKPSFFSTDVILEYSDDDLKELLAEYLHPRYINEAVTRYKINAESLKDKYQGDPRNIFKNKDAKEVIKSILEFRGFGPKTGNLFFRSMVNTFEYDLENIIDVLPPVDIHDVRIAHFMEYVDSAEMSSRNVQTVKNLWSNACKEANANWLKFDKALWLLGSQGNPKSKDDVVRLIDLK